MSESRVERVRQVFHTASMPSREAALRDLAISHDVVGGSGSIAKNRTPAWIQINILLLVLLGVAACDDASDGVTYTARYDVVVESAAARQLSKGLIWLFFPAVGDADVAPIDAPGMRLVTDNLGNRQISISLDDVPVGFELPLSFLVTWPAHASEATSPGVPAASQFMGAEPLIEIDQPLLRDRAASMRGSDLSETLANIRVAVSAVQPGPRAVSATGPPIAATEESAPEVPRGALSAIETGVGDSADRVLLAVALLRANGLPARPVVGIVDDGDGILAASERQLWAEYFSDGDWHALHLAKLSDSARAIPFRIYARARDLMPGPVADNFYRGAGLRVRTVE